MSEQRVDLVPLLGERILRFQTAAVVLLVLGIGGLIIYSIRLGPLVGPGVEESFGIAVALMFLMAALIAHLVDRTYRVYPFGRRLRPEPPPVITDAQVALFLRLVVVAAAAAGIAYVVAGLLPAF